MKFTKTLLLAAALMCAGSNAVAFDWTSLQGVISSVAGDDAGNILDNIIKTDKIEVADLAGTWKSSGPAVSFKSENLLEKAGGTAASATIESKLEPYYKKVGLDNATFTFTKEGAVTITLKSGKTITGTVEKGEAEGTMVFTFGKLKIGKLTAYVSKGTSLSIMFDASKLVKLVSAIAKYTKVSSLSTVSALLDSYDGVYAGFKFNKQ